jgi:hypothetical protein
MSYFDQYSGAAAGFASQYSIPAPVFFGLIQQESSWNPFASPGTTSAYGFTQLTNAAANQMGVNKYNPLQNLQGGAAYLSSMPGNTWAEKLAHYYQGPGANIGQAGMQYANSVLAKAQKMFGWGGDGGSSGGGINVGGAAATAAQGAACVAGDPMACMSAAGSLFGIGGGNDCGTFDFICKLRKWITESEFFTRLALATLALLFILGGLYLMKDRS